MNSMLENDQEKIDEGKAIKDAINLGLSSFTPDMLFESMVNNYSHAENIFGDKLIKFLSGYDPSYIDRNINIPEFQRELKDRLEEGFEKLQDDQFVDDDGMITDKGLDVASLILYCEELENIKAKGDFGEKYHKKSSVYGGKNEIRFFKKGDRYKDIALKRSIKSAIRRSHKNLEKDDLKVFERESKGKAYIIYGIDASGSMKGKKIDVSKKAGVALAYKAIDNNDLVGVLAFGDKVTLEVAPTDDFVKLLKEITSIRAARETDIAKTINHALQLFPREDVTKHLILLTDAVPTVGEDPNKDTLDAVSLANAQGITISLIGIDLNKEARKLAEEITELGNGRLYVVKNLDELDNIMIEEYYNVY